MLVSYVQKSNLITHVYLKNSEQ